MVRYYFDDYISFDRNRWSWDISNDDENRARFMRYRARKSPDKDILPDFTSIEKDAAKFDMSIVKFTDIFGITWEGMRGISYRVGAPDYEQHLYYYIDENNKDDSLEEDEVVVSSEFTRTNPPRHYIILNDNHIPSIDSKVYLYINDIKNVEYCYIVDNHLFKDTSIRCDFENDAYTIYSDPSNYKVLINALLKLGKKDLVSNLLDKMDEHFNKLKNSNRSDLKEHYPGMSAREYFKIKEKGI